MKRGALILRHLATAGAKGCALTELASRCGIPHPSVHRTLKQLIRERLVEWNRATHRYRLGPLTFELGLASSASFDIRDICSPAIDALAEATGDTVYLVGRSGFEAVCLHRVEGSFAIKTLVLDVGSRRPIGVGAGGLAILAAVHPSARAAIIERISPMLSVYRGLTATGLERACKRVSETGTSIIKGTVTLGVTAVGVAIRDTLGQPVASLSVASLSQRMSTNRIKDIAKQIRQACAHIEDRMRASHHGDWSSGIEASNQSRRP